MEGQAGKWGLWAAALSRVAGRKARQGRLGAALWAGVRTALAAFLEAARRLWLEVAGLLFALFALVGALAAWREYLAYAAGRIGPARALLAAGFAGVFGWFAVSSFWRSRRKSERP